MKKTLTPKRSASSITRQNVKPSSTAAGPGRMTLEFIRQFARCYQAAPMSMASGMPGYSLN